MNQMIVKHKAQMDTMAMVPTCLVDSKEIPDSRNRNIDQFATFVKAFDDESCKSQSLVLAKHINAFDTTKQKNILLMVPLN